MRYVRLLKQLRRRVENCWGWESQEVAGLIRAVEDLLLAGDRLPALLRANMQVCLDQGRGRRRSRRAASASMRRMLSSVFFCMCSFG